MNNTIEITDIGSIYSFKCFLGSLGNKVIYANNLNTGLQNSELYYIDDNNNQNYFIGKSGGNQTHGIFKTDGTATGTSLIIDGYHPGMIGQNFTSLNCLNNEIYAIDSMQRIFKTNGNIGNYQQINFTINNQLLQQSNYTWIKSLNIHNSKIYFRIDQYKNHGEEFLLQIPLTLCQLVTKILSVMI